MEKTFHWFSGTFFHYLGHFNAVWAQFASAVITDMPDGMDLQVAVDVKLLIWSRGSQSL